MNRFGDHALISGMFDLKGLRTLEKKIAGLRALLDDETDDADDAPDDTLNVEDLL